MFKNKLKKKLAMGETAIGSFVTCNSPDIAEVMALSGFEFIVIDTEHGPLSIESAMNIIRAAEVRGITPIIRVTDSSPTTILRSLDIGAYGVQVPQIMDKKSAQSVVQSVKYFPIGNRGLALPRAGDYGMQNSLEYFKEANKETLIVVHCENKESLENVEEIAQIPEIDVIFLGPFDMSQSFGIPAQVNHELIQDASQKIISICEKYNKAAGVFVMDGMQAKEKAKQGFRYITVGLDLTLLSKICINEIQNFRID